MSERTDKVITLLEPFGLGTDEARIYLELLEKGALSALQLSRILHMGRTKVYRILDSLMEMELATQEYDEAGFKFLASPTEQLEVLVAQREGEIQTLRKTLPEIKKLLEGQLGAMAPGSKVLYYRGKRGLSQVNWNVLRGQGQLLSFEVENLNAYMSNREAEKLRRDLVHHKILTRTITNLTQIKPFTQVRELVNDWWEIRSIAPEVFAVQADIFMYNDVYALCHYLDDGDVFCVELVNEKLTAMQKQIFEVLWGRAVRMEKIGDRGEARVQVQ